MKSRRDAMTEDVYFATRHLQTVDTRPKDPLLNTYYKAKISTTGYRRTARGAYEKPLMWDQSFARASRFIDNSKKQLKANITDTHASSGKPNYAHRKLAASSSLPAPVKGRERNPLFWGPDRKAEQKREPAKEDSWDADPSLKYANLRTDLEFIKDRIPERLQHQVRIVRRAKARNQYGGFYMRDDGIAAPPVEGRVLDPNTSYEKRRGTYAVRRTSSSAYARGPDGRPFYQGRADVSGKITG
jgi:hypothetical protein